MDADRWDRRRERVEARLSRRGASGFVLGGMVVIVGLLLLLDNMGIIRSRDFLRFWPLLLIAFGLSRVAEGCGIAGKIWGGVIALVGALLLLDEFDLVTLNVNLIWPLVVIGFGLTMLVRAVGRRRALSGAGASSGSDVSLVGIFSGGRRRIDSTDFRGCEVVTFCGGFEIDLRNATIADGKATVDINAMFGGVEIFVPDHWKVLMNGMGIFGGFEDKTTPPRVVEGTPIPELVVTGYAIFGGASVRN